MPAEAWRVLAKAHERRNIAEYGGRLEYDEKLMAELAATAARLCAIVVAFPSAR